MPELPEVETVRRGLERHVVGARVQRVEVGRERSVRRTSPAHLVAGLTGARFDAVRRRGKYLLADLDTGLQVMVHLRMSGQLLLAPAGAARPPHTHVVMALEWPHGVRPDPRAGELWFVDPRTFGEVVVFDPDRRDAELPELARLGVDPVADGLTRRELRSIVRSRRRPLKSLLVDQHLIAGIGNIYADEILHRARVRPDRRSDSLSIASEARLHHSIVEVLHEAISARGSTLADGQYVDLMGEHGSYQLRHRVYGRGGARCVSCGRGIVRRMVVGQRSWYFCPWCQR